MPTATEPYPLARKLYPTVRQSVLQSFDNCALLARFEREHRGGWSHPWQARGEMFHRFAARSLTEMYRQGERKIEVDVALAIFREVLRQDDIDRECPACESTRIRKGVTKMGMRMCLACKHRFETDFIIVPTSQIQELYWVVKKWAHDNYWSIENLVDVEQRLRATITYPSDEFGPVERMLTGQIDALFIEGQSAETAILLDWKDMWGMPGPTDVSFQGYFQQRFYGWLVMRNYKSVQEVTLREFYVRFSQPREATIRREDMPEIEAEISALVEKFDRTLQERLYVASPGKHCSFCPTPQRCPIPPEAREDGALTTQDEAERAAATILVSQTVIERRTSALKAWCTNHGPVEVKNAKGRTVMGFLEHTQNLRPTQEEISRAEAEKGEPLTSQEIGKLYRKRTGTKFTSYTPSAELEEESDEEVLASLGEAVASVS